jgi:hypothetical protein
MATITTQNPLVLTLDENIRIRPIFKKVTAPEQMLTIESVVITATWRDCVDGTLRNGTPPSDYVEVPYTQGGGGTCWEPRAVIGFEPDLNQVLQFSWRRGTSEYPQTKLFNMTNPSSTLTFDVTITTNSQITVTPASFKITPRSSQKVGVTPSAELINALGDGVSNIDFNIEIKEVV